jgi:hypothetical protein
VTVRTDDNQHENTYLLLCVIILNVVMLFVVAPITEFGPNLAQVDIFNQANCFLTQKSGRFGLGLGQGSLFPGMSKGRKK